MHVDLNIYIKCSFGASPRYLVIGGAADRDAQSGQLITNAASRREKEGVIRGKVRED